jgi:acyl carrier protein
MTEPCHEVVVLALAAHLAVDPLAIESRQDLEEDWGLDALDLAFVALQIEDALEIELPGSALDAMRTVGDLEAAVRRAPSTQCDELGLASTIRPSLRETIRRGPQRARGGRNHRQLRRALRRSAA